MDAHSGSNQQGISAGKHRSSRWNGVSRHPTDLESIIRGLGRAKKRMKSFPDRKSLRGALSGAGKDYENRGAADDLARYLLNMGIVLEGGDRRLYYDQERGEEVLADVQAKAVPRPASDPVQRLREILAEPEASPARTPLPAPLAEEAPAVHEQVAISVQLEGLEAYTIDGLRLLSEPEIDQYAALLGQRSSELSRALSDVEKVRVEHREQERQERLQKLNELREEERREEEARQERRRQIAELERLVAAPA